MRCCLVAAVLLVGCQAFQEQDDDAALPEAGVDGPRPERALVDALWDRPPAVDIHSGDAPPLAPCATLPLPCLDPTPAEVIEVPTEATAATAFADAKANDTIQIRGKTLGSGWKIPPFVTLRGCQGAKIEGTISFLGSGGTVEGFEVQGAGSVIANQSGAYTIRHNRFGAADTVHGVSARSVDGLVSATVTAVVEANGFEDRSAGIEARTQYDTGTHTVEITIRNNAFNRVERPITISEGGLVGKITATVEHNTLHDFTTGLQITDTSQAVKTRGNLLVKGTTAVSASSPFEVSYSATWQVTKPGSTPFSGSFASADPALVDPTAGDLRPGAASAVVDVIPASAPMPVTDLLGCPRPVAIKGTDALGDMGAIELQP